MSRNVLERHGRITFRWFTTMAAREPYTRLHSASSRRSWLDCRISSARATMCGWRGSATAERRPSRPRNENCELLVASASRCDETENRQWKQMQSYPLQLGLPFLLRESSHEGDGLAEASMLSQGTPNPFWFGFVGLERAIVYRLYSMKMN